MIKITASYFAAFRERAGLGSESLETTAETTGELYREVAACHGFADSTSLCKVAVNDALSGWDHPLHDGDTVLFFPPIAGG